MIRQDGVRSEVLNTVNRFVAAALGFLMAPLAMLYVGRWKWALVYFVLTLFFATVGGFFFKSPAIVPAFAFATSVIGAVHAYRLAGQYPVDQQRPAYSRWYGLLSILALVYTPIFLFRVFGLDTFRVPSGGMQPTISAGSWLLVKKWGYGNYGAYGISLMQIAPSAPLRRGDLFVIAKPGQPSTRYVQRLIGLPGDLVEYQDKRISINGVAAPTRRVGDFSEYGVDHGVYEESLFGERYGVLLSDDFDRLQYDRLERLEPQRCTALPTGIRCRVPEGGYFFMGDHRDDSIDSRIWGFIPVDHLVGKVIHVGR